MSSHAKPDERVRADYVEAGAVAYLRATIEIRSASEPKGRHAAPDTTGTEVSR